jgi:hypothetical protein
MENISYSAMLNIAETSSAPESVPSNSGNSIVIEHKNPTQHWSSSIDSRNYPVFLGIPTNSGIAQKCMEFLGISIDSGIPEIQSNSGIAWNRRNSIDRL